MRTWIVTRLVLIVAIGLGLVLREHSGNVLIVAQPWRIELSLTFAVLLLIAGFFVAYFAVRVLSWVFSSPERFRTWRGWRNEKRDHELQIGRASCRERVCQSVLVSVVAV